MDINKIHNEVGGYYSGKYLEFGMTPQGVDWNSEESQHTRFDQLSKVITEDEDFTLLDFGCGYGAFYYFLKDRFPRCKYTGFDISAEMRSAAMKNCIDKPDCRIIDENELGTYHYIVASGIFNVMLDIEEEKWQDYIENTLIDLNRRAIKGFSFNMLTTFSDAHLMKKYLYYASPTEYFDYCKNKFSRNVALLHDYDLYEFTILVKKNSE